MHRILWRLFWIAALSLRTYPAVAAEFASATPADKAGRAAVVIERDDSTTVVQRDGSYVKTVELLQRANTVAGAAALSPMYRPYEAGVSTLTVLEAYTIDAQGERHDVPSSSMRDISVDAATRGAPTFTDWRQRVLLFPDLTAGGKAFIRYREEGKSLLIDAFSDARAAPGWPVEQSTTIYDLPSDLLLRADRVGYVAMPPVAHDGRTQYRFDYRRPDARVARFDTLRAPNVGDHLIVSTFADYGVLAASYRSLLGPPVATDAAVATLARTLTAKDSDDRAKAATLYDWVRLHIRYVAVHLGRGDLIPHAPTEVLRDGYGDCKDVVGLYGALLDAVGIAHDAVLLRAEGALNLPSVPAMQFFDHVITYLPSLSTYADLTASTVQFGYLPPQLLGAPGVRISDGAVVQLPRRQASVNRARFDIALRPNGDADFTLHFDWDGAAAEFQRSVMRNLPPAVRRSAGNAWFAADGFLAETVLETSDVQATHGPFRATLQGRLTNFVLPVGTTEIQPAARLQAPLFPTMTSLTAHTRRSLPFRCDATDVQMTVRIELPPGATVAYLPDDVDVHVPHLDYQSRYHYDVARREIELRRDTSLAFDGAVCSPALGRDVAAVANVVSHDLAAHVIVKMPPSAHAADAVVPTSFAEQGRRNNAADAR